MEMDRRIAAGRLSEILGPSSLGSDVTMRRLGLYRNAEKIWKNLGPDEKAMLQAYVDGVNSGLGNTRTLPLEFHVIDFKPQKWTAVDSIALLQLMAWKYSSNVNSEMERFRLAQKLGPKVANELMPGVPENIAENVAMNSLPSVSPAPSGSLFENASDTRKYIGSNSWAVSGKHTESGFPILANDPHLTTPIPSLWYLARMHGGELSAVGATMPGLPFIFIGRNEHIAWGMTNAMADTQDIVLEEINPLNRSQYKFNQVFVDMDVSREEIRVKGEFLRPAPMPEVIEIRRTRNGPMLSDLGGPLGNIAYSVRWTGDDDMGGTISSLLKLNYAKNWSEFNAALSTFVAPVHNFIYADKYGNIGSLAPGLLPIRRIGNGSVPVRSRDANVWEGWIPYDSVPRSFNPPEGYIVAANNKIVPEKYPYHITSDWAVDYRARRIESELVRLIDGNKAKLGVQEMRRLQNDVISPATANGVLKRMQAVQATTETQRGALSLIRQWNGDMAADSPAAALYAAWTSHLSATIFSEARSRYANNKGANEVLRQLMFSDNEQFIERVLVGDSKAWCPRFGDGTGDACAELLSRTLDRAIEELGNELGSNEKNWHWSSLHKTEFTHFPFNKPELAPGMPFVQDRVLTSFFDRSASNGGGGNTVNVAPISFVKETKYKQFIGPMYRQIIDLGKDSSSIFSQGTGQSGNPFSPHYDDLLKNHGNGDYLSMAKSLNIHSLHLLPVNQQRDEHGN
jgi:penicillin amidase